MELKINCSHPCSQCQWNDTPTPSENKTFNFDSPPELDYQKKLYEDYRDQTQQKLLEREGEINWYRQRNSFLESKLTEFQENEEELWNHLEYLEDQLDQKEQVYTVWQAELQDRLHNCCQTELKLEELLHRYKKGKLSWEQHANLLTTELQATTAENESLRNEIEEFLDYKNHWQTSLTKLAEQEELLASKNSTITNLVNQTKNFHNKLQQTTTTLNQKTTFIQQQQQEIAALKQDKQNLQNWKNNHTCSFTCQENCCLDHDYDTIKQERDTYQAQLLTKDQKIAELEQIIHQLRNKPPIQPINNLDKPANSSQQQPNNLLATIEQQKATIQQLETKLQSTPANSQQIIIKEIPVENGELIHQLRTKLKSKEQTINQLHLIYLLLMGISILLLTYLARIIKKKLNRS